MDDLLIKIDDFGNEKMATLTWSPVTEDTAGNPVTVDDYQVFSKPGDYDTGVWSFVGSTQDTTLVFPIESTETEFSRFFHVIAYRDGIALNMPNGEVFRRPDPDSSTDSMKSHFRSKTRKSK